MISAIVSMMVSSENRQKVVDLIRPIIEPTLVQPGCVSCRMYQDVANADALTYEEVWRSQKGLEQHIRSELYENILVAMEFASQQPEIHFNTIARSRGIEVIYAARKVEDGVA